MKRPLEAQKSVELDKEILKAIKGIRYGSVEIVIHDARVVQIERKERIRFEERVAER